MSNEEKNNEGQTLPPQPDAATTPIDLASAFKALNQANREAAQEPVETGEPSDDGGVDEPESVENPNGNAESEGTIESGSDNEYGSGDDGGSSDVIDAIDFNAYKQGILRDIQRNAQTQVRREFNEQNIGYYSIAELQIRDEQSGKVRYRNPDVQDERDPDYYFKSRTEAQNFCESWNKGVDFEFRKAVNEKQQVLLQQEAPKARLIDFLPRWQSMDSKSKKVFDTLLEGHEVRDANGKEIGYNVNLYTVADQAERIAKSFGGGSSSNEQSNQQNTAKSKANPSGGPALDMQTGNGKSIDEAEPKNIGEALKMFDKKNKGGK